LKKGWAEWTYGLGGRATKSQGAILTERWFHTKTPTARTRLEKARATGSTSPEFKKKSPGLATRTKEEREGGAPVLAIEPFYAVKEQRRGRWPPA